MDDLFDMFAIAIITETSDEYIDTLASGFNEIYRKDHNTVYDRFLNLTLDNVFIHAENKQEIKDRVIRCLAIISRTRKYFLIDAVVVNAFRHYDNDVIDILSNHKHKYLSEYHRFIKDCYHDTHNNKQVYRPSPKETLYLRVYNILNHNSTNNKYKYEIDPDTLKQIIKIRLDVLAKSVTPDKLEHVIDQLHVVRNIDLIFKDVIPIDPKIINTDYVYEALNPLGKALVVGSIDAVSVLINRDSFEKNKEQIEALVGLARMYGNIELAEHIVLTMEILPFI